MVPHTESNGMNYGNCDDNFTFLHFNRFQSGCDHISGNRRHSNQPQIRFQLNSKEQITKQSLEEERCHNCQ